jgi:uncharacterized SAM-binding protein YcdF (DUF218 family)
VIIIDEPVKRGTNMFGVTKNQDEVKIPDDSLHTEKPIEPERGKITKPQVLKWIFFLLFIIYFLISSFHAPILTCMGEYLVIEHTPQKSDLIVCLGGENIARGLATVDAFNDGLAPNIYISRSVVPDGYDLLKERGIEYPEQADLLERLLKDSGIPESAIIHNDVQVNMTLDEAQAVRKEVLKRGFKSIIIITSPTHSRRAWLTYMKVFEDTDVRIISLPTKYSGYRTEDWWKDRKYLKEVLIEYEKLIYYIINYHI